MFAFEPELAIVLQLDRVAGVAAVLPETAPYRRRNFSRHLAVGPE